MSRQGTESAVDRLIALASDEKSAEPQHENPGARTDLEAIRLIGEAPTELQHNPMWQALMQFRVMLPYVSRLLDMSHTDASPALSNELKQSVGDLAVAQRDLRMTLQDQMAQMKRLEEEMTRAREAAERSVTENLEMVDDVRSVHSIVKRVAFVGGGLLLVVLALVIWLLVRGHA